MSILLGILMGGAIFNLIIWLFIISEYWAHRHDGESLKPFKRDVRLWTLPALVSFTASYFIYPLNFSLLTAVLSLIALPFVVWQAQLFLDKHWPSKEEEEE